MAGSTEAVNIPKQPYYADKNGDHCESSNTNDADVPTEEERQTLRKVADKLPWSAFLVALVELCERFAYYGLTGPFQVRALLKVSSTRYRASDIHPELHPEALQRSSRPRCNWFGAKRSYRPEQLLSGPLEY